MWRDLRYAMRTLVRTPVFTIAATLALGLAIGANATIFSLVDALWFRPPGVRAPGELARVFATTASESEGPWSYPEYTDLRERTTSFSGVIARGRRGTIMAAADGTPELLLVNVVSANFFSTLGVNAQYGRVFVAGDQNAAQPAIVLGHAFWRRRFGGDPSIVGRTVNLSRGRPVPMTVIGVLPATFRDLDASADRDIWMPPQAWVSLTNREELERRDGRWFELFARKRARVSIEVAQAEVAGLAASFARDYPAISAGRGARVVSDLRYRLDSGGVNALALLGLVLLVVLITCVNVANLLLARAAARAREFAVRVAIGATRWRLLRQLLTESLVLGTAGAVAGLLIAAWLIHLLPVLLTPPPGFRSFVLFEADLRVLVFTLVVTLLTTMLFGIVPTWTAARTDAAPIIKNGPGGIPSRRPGLLPNALVTSQVVISLVLLSAAGVLARSFFEMRRVDLGFTRKPVLTAWITLEEAPPGVMEEGVHRLEALPGVTGVAVALRAPLSLSGGGLAQPVYLPDAPVDPRDGLPNVKFNAVSANYFAIMGTRIVEGRAFDSSEERGGPPAIVVNQQFAARYLPGRTAVGGVVRLGGSAGTDHRIVGIAQNAIINEISETPEPYFYVPFWRSAYGEMTYLIASNGDAAALAETARDGLKRLDRRLDPRRLVTMGQYIDYSESTYKATAWLALALGTLGLLLTAIGVYGVVAYRTGRRAREIGIRIALGAERAQVLRLLLRDGVRVALIGVGIGVPAAMLSTRFLASMLFGVGPWDLPAFSIAAVLLVTAVCAATFVPAWRATRVNPSVSLRDN